MLWNMLVISEEAATAIRAAYETRGEFSAAVELRRHFPGIIDNAEVRGLARAIAGWQPLLLKPTGPVPQVTFGSAMPWFVVRRPASTGARSVALGGASGDRLRCAWLIRERFAAVGHGLNERSHRLLAAAEAKTAGYGGIAAASRATGDWAREGGIARSTIGRGLKDLADPGSLSGKVRRPGSGCPPLTLKDPTLLENLRLLVEPATMGGPMRPLLWVSKSHEKLAAALRELGTRSRRAAFPNCWVC
jgi:hypothetical protein